MRLLSFLRFWFLLLVAVTPVSISYVVNKGVAVSYLNLLSLVFIAVSLVAVGCKQLKLQKIPDRATLRVIGLFVLTLAYALLFTHPLRNGIGLWGSRLVQPLVVAYFAYQLFENAVVSLRDLAMAFAMSLLILIIGGGLQMVHILPPGMDPHRVTVLYQYPNTLARYIDILLLLTLPWILWQNQGKRRTLFLALWAIGVLLLLLTESYNGVVTLTVGVVVLLIAVWPRYKKWATMGLVGLAILIGIVALNVSHLPKWQTSITDSRLTRLEFWQIARATIHDNLWTGIGLKGWETQYTNLVWKYGPNPPRNWASAQPHNFFLDSLLKAGIPGLIFITLLLAWPGIKGWQLFRRSALEKYGWLGIAVLSYTVAMFCFGLIDDPLWSDDTVPILFIVLFATIYALYKDTKQS